MTDPVIPFKSEDQLMLLAIDQARKTINFFIDSFCHPKKNQTSFLLKVMFENEQSSEHIWVADLDFSTLPAKGTVTGTIANEPKMPGLGFMQRIEFHPSKVTDWMFIEDGYLVGGYTTRVIRACMTAEERLAFDSNAPYKIRD